MKYHLDLCTAETWRVFCEKDATVVGFRARWRGIAETRVSPGDILLAYMTGLSRWCGAVEVESPAYFDDTPLYGNPDPFPIRFRVKPIVLLTPEYAIPIFERQVWDTLSMTRPYELRQGNWTGFFRRSLNTFEDEDGVFLLELLKQQEANRKAYPLTDKDKRQLASTMWIQTLDREVEVAVPDEEDQDPPFVSEVEAVAPTSDVRESIRYQAKVAEIGVEMGFHIWLPRNDRSRVLELVDEDKHEKFLDRLPLNYDDITLRTIEQIDVLWLKGRAMARAFEIEHTTAIYSGLLRMADLLALQPNMDIQLHIVAPPERRDMVVREIRRPVFSLLEHRPLYERCSYLSYEDVDELARLDHLRYVRDTIIKEYEDTGEP